MLSRLLSVIVLAGALGALALPSPRSSLPAIPFTAKFNTSNSDATRFNVAQADRARIDAIHQRAQALKSGSGNAKRAAAASVDATNSAVLYTTTVSIGSPASEYTLVIDTGSSNTWAGSRDSNPYVRTSTTNCSSGTFTEVEYGTGLFFGEECTDTVALGSTLVVQNMSIGYALVTYAFDDVDGILGIGPKWLTAGTVDGMTDYIPTFIDDLAAQKTIPSDMFSVYFQPTTTAGVKNGELTIGGIDSAKIEKPVSYVPLTTANPSMYYWGIDVAMNYNGTLLDKTGGIVDTGTTLTYIASDAFEDYQTATASTLDNETGLLRITPDQFNDLLDLEIVIGDETYVLTPNAQVWPRELNSDIGGTDESLYLVINDIGSMSGSGLDFILGYTFLERYYSVFDTTNHRVGFAPTTQTMSDIN